MHPLILTTLLILLPLAHSTPLSKRADLVSFCGNVNAYPLCCQSNGPKNNIVVPSNADSLTGTGVGCYHIESPGQCSIPKYKISCCETLVRNGDSKFGKANECADLDNDQLNQLSADAGDGTMQVAEGLGQKVGPGQVDQGQSDLGQVQGTDGEGNQVSGSG